MKHALYFLILTLVVHSAYLNSMDEPTKKPRVEKITKQKELDRALYSAIKGNNKWKPDEDMHSEEDSESETNEDLNFVHDLELITELIKKGANVNTNICSHMPPLCLAVRRGYSGVAKLLLDNDANVDSRFSDPDITLGTPLHLAVQDGDRDMVQLLLQYKADVNALDAEQQAPLHRVWGCTSENDSDDEDTLIVEIMKLLINAGASVAISTPTGESLLHLAVAKNKLLAAEFLISLGVDVNACDKYGKTPLHEAAMNNLYAMVNLLLKHGADINMQDNKGFVPWCLALKALNWELASKCITDYGPRMSAIDPINITILHNSYRYDPLILKILLGDTNEVKQLIEREQNSDNLKNAFKYAVGQAKIELLPSILDKIREHVDVQKTFRLVEGILAKWYLTQEERKKYQEVKSYLAFCLPSLVEQIMQRRELREAIVKSGKLHTLPTDLLEKLIISALKAGDVEQASVMLVQDALFNKLISLDSERVTLALYQAVFQWAIHGEFPLNRAKTEKIVEWCLEQNAIPTELFLRILSDLKFPEILAKSHKSILTEAHEAYCEKALLKKLFEVAHKKGVPLTKDIQEKYLPILWRAD